MSTRKYWGEVREIEASLPREAFVTAVGSGVCAMVDRSLAALLIHQGTHRPANSDENQRYLAADLRQRRIMERECLHVTPLQ